MTAARQHPATATARARLVSDVLDAVLCLVLAASCAFVAAGGFYVAPQVQHDPLLLVILPALLTAALVATRRSRGAFVAGWLVFFCIAAAAMLLVGDRVAAIGNPLGETFRSTLTDGIISAIARGINYKGRSMTLLQTNTALNEGNSGGALFNMYGQVIGITNMKMMSSNIEGIAFAIPSGTVVEVVNNIAQNGEVRGRPSIGITVGGIPSVAMSEYSLPSGLYISEVVEFSDAYAKGIRPGDILLEVNHIPVTTTDDVNDIKSGYGVGDSLLFTIWRNGETFEVEVLLMDTNDLYR